MTDAKKRIVIAGAGFGGITAALTLARYRRRWEEEAEVILIDRHRHQLYTPALYEIAAIPRGYTSDHSLKASPLIPIAEIIRGKPITFLCDEVTGLEPELKTLFLESRGGVRYDKLIVALGSETNYFGIPGLKEMSFPLKTPDDALRLRNAIEHSFSAKDSLKIVVGGGGSSGVELVAEFVNFICTLNAHSPEKNNLCNVHFLLIEAAQTLLPGFAPWVAERAEKRLKKLGIEVRTRATLTQITPQELSFMDGSREPYDIFIWTGGVKGSSVLTQFHLPLSSKGAVLINQYLHPQGNAKDIYAIGDSATFINPLTRTPLLWNVPVAESQGRSAAHNILRTLERRSEYPFVPLKKYPFILAVGKKYAIADLVLIRFSGFLGWTAKTLVELRYLLFILPPRSALFHWWRNIWLYRSND